MTDELLDVVEPTGAILRQELRSVVHRDGLWHQTFHCLVVRSGSPPRVVLQRRRAGTTSFPGRLDISVAGHLGAGEEPLHGIRELREELGIDVDPARLVSLGRRMLADDAGEGRNREIAHVYLLVDDTPLANFNLDPAEIGGLVELTIADLLAMLEDPMLSVQGQAIDTSGTTEDVTCSVRDLVPVIDGYWVVLATMALQHTRGLHPLGI
ncbi:MAG: NUDIX hydrolase [Ilumatobacteraceae bacterium]